MKFTPGAPGRAPVIEFDPRPPEAAIAMYAAATWPNDRARQQQWLAVQQAVLITKLRNPPAHLRAADISRVQEDSQRRERDPAEVAKENRGILLDTAMARFEAIGGLGTVVEAPAYQALVADVVSSAHGAARRAGEVLLTVACMQEHHPELPPSVNRAMAVIEKRYSRPGARKLADVNERGLKDAWRDGRSTAPLWAALVFHEHAISGRGLPIGSAFLDPLHRHLVLAAAAWFREFAGKFQPKRAREPLIPIDDTLELRVGVDAAQPLLLPLPSELLDVAKKYTVKTIKHGY